MMRIVKDLTEEILNAKFILKSASNVKFMAIINPEETPDLILELYLRSMNCDILISEDAADINSPAYLFEYPLRNALLLSDCLYKTNVYHQLWNKQVVYYLQMQLQSRLQSEHA